MHRSKQIQLRCIYNPMMCINHKMIRNERGYDLSKNNSLIGIERYDVTSLHSNATGLFAIRGDSIDVEVIVSSSVNVSSFTPGGASTLVIFIASAMDRRTRFTTNSRVAKTLAAVSLS